MGFLNSNIWVIISFLAFTILVAVIASVKTKGDNLESADGYFLASRSLPGYVIAGSLLLTNLSAEQLVGLNGQSWQTNMSPSAFEVGSIFTLLFLAHYFLPRYLKMGTTTIPAMMEERFGKGVKLMFSAIIVLMYSFLNLPVILYSGSVAFVRIFNFDKLSIFNGNQFAAIAVLCVVIGIVGCLLRNLRRSEGRCCIRYHQRYWSSDCRLPDPVHRSGSSGSRSWRLRHR